MTRNHPLLFHSHCFMINFVTELSNSLFESVSTEVINESKIRQLFKQSLHKHNFFSLSVE